MSGVSLKKLTLKCFALLLLVICLLLFSRDSTRSLLASQASQGRGQLPPISIEPQGDAPLRIAYAFIETPGPESFTVRVMLQNHGGKSIRAFAIAAGNSGSNNQGARVEFLNLTKPDSVLRPAQTKTIGIAYGANEPPKAIALFVDFVEFNDGTTWGADLYNSRDRLGGQREGAKAERRRLQELFKTGGRAALLDSINSGPGEIYPAQSPDRSEEWRQGFRSGAGSMRQRVARALQWSDPSQVGRELSKPYDTAEENP